jgi:CheY-like chemotaxis protein
VSLHTAHDDSTTGHRRARLSPSSVRWPRVRGLRVLVVEDDPDSLELVTHVLREAGSVVIQAENGRTAFDQFVSQKPDVIVADLHMPQGDGYELIHRIRSLPEEEGKMTAAIAISAVHGVQTAMRAGYNAFIGKPLEEWNLLDLIEKVLSANVV